MDEESIKCVIDLAASHPQLHPLPDGARGLVVPERYRVEQFQSEYHLPDHIRQSAIFYDEASFLTYLECFKMDQTIILGGPGFLRDNGSAMLDARIDYHVDSDHPGQCAHVARYRPRYSQQWKTWSKTLSFGQAEFAEFIEENRQDVTEPDAASLLDVVRSFKARRKQDFDSVVYQPNGDVKLAYDDKTEQTGESGVLPEKLTLGIPVYFKGPLFSVPIFVRYRVGDGKVKFELKPDRADLIEDAAFQDIMDRVEEASNLPVLLGDAS